MDSLSPETTGQPASAAGLRAASGSAVLFLDVDGVLNSVGTRERSPHGTYGVEDAKVELLYKIVDATDCDIVVSSPWRKHDDLLTHLHDLLKNLSCRIIGVTPVLDRRTASGLYVAKVRGDEIQAWLAEHPEVKRFVIVDDDSDMAHLAPHLVKTDGREGLTADLAETVIRRLNDTLCREAGQKDV